MNNHENIISDCQSYYNKLIEDINGAKVSIDLETYIFSTDPIGQKIAEALATAAKRGVKVRVLVDGAGTPVWGSTLTRLLETSGVKTRIFHPFPWRLWQWSRSVVRVPTILKAIYLLLKINSRNHRKVCIIDNDIAYIGSLNICQSHLDKEQWGESWRDIAVRLNGTELGELAFAFEAAWNHMPIQERLHEIFRHINKNPVFRLNNTRHRRRILYKNLLRRISQCKERIWITNAYFVPDTFLLKKLEKAAQRGVDVRILLPKKSDVFIMPWASATFYYRLVHSGVRVFEYLPTMLHAKSLILDDWVTIGSSNLNHRSLLHDLEVDVNIRFPESKQLIAQQFLEDLKKAREVQLNDWMKRPYHQRIFGHMALFLKYWI